MLASKVDERLLKLIEQAEVDIDGETLMVTASIGLSVRLVNEQGNASCLIKEADECLYQAKSEGRNQVCFGRIEEKTEAAVSRDEKDALLGMFSGYSEE